MLDLRSPATLLDMAAIVGRVTPVHWDIAREMWSNGRTWSLAIGDQLIGVFGVYPGEGFTEAWFMVRPEARAHMLFICRQMRLTLDRLDYPEIVVFCETEAGRRIAALAGFTFATQFENREIWRYERDVRWGAESCPGAAEKAAGSPTATATG